MIYNSPAKLLRSVKRNTKFIEKKNESLAVYILSSLDIFPVVQTLSISQTFSVNIPPLECFPHVPPLQLVETRDHNQQCQDQPELEHRQVQDDDVLKQRRFFEII